MNLFPGTKIERKLLKSEELELDKNENWVTFETE